jgi:hypothetical protein
LVRKRQPHLFSFCLRERGGDWRCSSSFIGVGHGYRNMLSR